MAHRIRITGVPREKPNIGLYVLALIELARQQQARAKEGQTTTEDREAEARRKEAPDEQ